MKPKAQVEYRAIADLKELPGNPRTIKKDQFEKLKQSRTLRRDMFKFIKRKEREQWLQTKLQRTASASPRQ